MSKELTEHVRRALVRIVYPLVRILLRYGVAYDEFAALAKRAYVEVAQDEFSLTARPASKSRIALLTGINRREVARVLEQPPEFAGDGLEALNRSARIVANWIRDPQFQDVAGAPAELPATGDGASFEALVRKYGGDIPAMAVLRELKNAGAVSETSDGRWRLASAGYVPTGSEIDKLDLLGIDVGALMGTINHNLLGETAPRFQRKVSFRRLSPAGIEALQAFAADKGQQLLLELDAELAPHDLPDDEAGDGHFAGLGIYLFIEDNDEGSPS